MVLGRLDETGRVRVERGSISKPNLRRSGATPVRHSSTNSSSRPSAIV